MLTKGTGGPADKDLAVEGLLYAMFWDVVAGAGSSFGEVALLGARGGEWDGVGELLDASMFSRARLIGVELATPRLEFVSV